MFIRIGDHLFNLDKVLSIKPEPSSATMTATARIKTIDGSEYVVSFKGSYEDLVKAVANTQGLVII